MSILKSCIPQGAKSAIKFFLQRVGKVPLRLAYAQACRTYVEEGGKVSAAKKAQRYRAATKAVLSYLNGKYGKLAAELAADYVSGTKPAIKTIWVFWWQGEADAPDIVKRCIASIRRNSNGMNVNVIDFRNYKSFVSVPEVLSQKMNAGFISFTHFSDYYRMALLAKHGGLWVDASVFLKDSLSESIFDIPLFSIKNPGKDITNISNWEWTVGIIGGWRGNTLFSAAARLLQEYWTDHNSLVDYLLFDYMIRLIYMYCSELRDTLDLLPANNSDFMFLQSHLSDPSRNYNDIKIQKTQFYKVSWKREYPLTTPEGCETVYAKWLAENPPHI